MHTDRNQIINEDLNNQVETLVDWTFKGVSITDPLSELGPTVENCTDFRAGDYIVYKDVEFSSSIIIVIFSLLSFKYFVTGT